MPKFNSLESLSALKNIFSEENSNQNLEQDETKTVPENKVNNPNIEVVQKQEIIESKKETRESLIPSIKIGDWASMGYIGGEWESRDGYMAGNDAREVRFLHAGLQINIDKIFPIKGFINVMDIESFCPEEIMNDCRKQLEKNNKRTDREHIPEEKINEALQEIEKKLPKFEEVKNPYIVQMQDLQKSMGYEYDNYYMIDGKHYSGIEKKLLGIPYGNVLVKHNEKEEKREITVSSLEKIISLDDAQRRNIPVKQYDGSIFANFPENQNKFDELRREEIKTFDEESDRVFEADVVLESISNEFRKIAYYTIKNVEVPANKLEVIENLIDGSEEENYLGRTTTLKDIVTSKIYNSDETPLPSGRYQIELTIPKSGRDRGRTVYSIISNEQRALREQYLQDSLEEEKNDPYQQELAKTATLMKGLIGSHRDQQGLDLYAVKEADGFWQAYVGEPLHLQRLKGFKSSSKSETVNGLIKILKEAGYSAD